MVNYVLYFAPLLALALGYLAGRYQAVMIDKIRTLEEQSREPAPTPAVTMGEYAQPKPVSTAPDDRAVGLVETKTPERVAFETTDAIEREGRGFNK